MIRSVLAVLRHPELWATLVRQARVLAPPRWWTRRPFLPVPDRAYLRFRLVTAYGGDGSADGGDGSAVPDPEDLVTYLRWCRAFPLVTGP